MEENQRRRECQPCFTPKKFRNSKTPKCKVTRLCNITPGFIPQKIRNSGSGVTQGRPWPLRGVRSWRKGTGALLFIRDGSERGAHDATRVISVLPFVVLLLLAVAAIVAERFDPLVFP